MKITCQFRKVSYLCGELQNPMAQMKVIFLPEAKDFIATLDADARKKIFSDARFVESGEKDDRVFKKIDKKNDIWEIRTAYRRMEYRLFAFWDTREGTLVVATHGMVKKTQKTPAKEIKKAVAIKNKYFNE